MTDCKPCTMSVDTHTKVSSDMGALSAAQPLTATWSGLSNISPSRPDISYTIQHASTCTTLISPISRLRSASSATSRTPSTTVCFFIVPLHPSSSSTLTLTGQVVPTLACPLRATRCFWATTSSPSPRSARMSSRVQVLRQSTALWPPMWRRHADFLSCLWSCIAPYQASTYQAC
jgi:hypothetical protein